MSLEQSLDNHAAAIRELIAAFGGKAGGISIKENPLITVRDGLGAEGNTRTEVKEKAETKKPAPAAKAVESTSTPKQEVSTAVVPDAKPAIEHQSDAPVSDSAEASTVSFSAARDLVLKLASANKREEVKAVNTKHGIAKLGSLLKDENDYNTVTDQAKLEAVYADLLAIEV